MEVDQMDDKKDYDGYDVYYKSGSRWRRLHNGVFTTREGAEARMEQYRKYGVERCLWTKNMKVDRANVQMNT